MGSCFLAHGLRYLEGNYNAFAAKSIASLNLLAACFVLVPSTLYMVEEGQGQQKYDEMMILSHGISVILLCLYAIYLFFALFSHSRPFNDYTEDEEETEIEASKDLLLGPTAAIVWLISSLAMVTLCTLVLVSSFQHSPPLSAMPQFVGFILFPFLANITDYLSSLTVAWRDELNITILATIGSSMRMMLFTLPSLVVLGRFIDQPMALKLDPFEAGVVFFCVFVSCGLVQNAKSNYLIGALSFGL